MLPRQRRHRPGTLVLPLLLLAAPGARAAAQGCVSVASRAGLVELSGRRVESVAVSTADPDPLPGPAALLMGLHVRTRESTVRREILLAAGDTVDTLKVAESLRRLRRLRYLIDAEVRARDCGGALALTFATRDAWSTRPNVRVGSTSAAVELSERNLLGMGQQATLAVRSDRGRIGIGATLLDPAALGDRAALAIGGSRYRDGSEWFATIGRRERSVLDEWSYEAFASQSARLPKLVEATAPTAPTAVAAVGVLAPPGETFRRGRGGALVGRRILESEAAVTSLQAGVEYERAGLVAGPTTPRLGAERVRREFAAIDFGVRRRSVAYDTLTWFLPADAIVDVPLSFEFDALAGAGREMTGGTVAAHLDLWGGRMWRTGATSLIVADAWGSGYLTPGRLTAATLRAGGAYYAAAPRGLWSARLGAEWLLDPDPDLRAMVTADPTAGALPARGRLAEAAMALSVERAVRLRPVSRSWHLDGAAFGAVSTRWDPVAGVMAERAGLPVSAGDGLERLDLGVLGLGLRLTPARAGRATARLDLGYPLLRSGGVRARPFVAISITPWLDQERHRDGRSEP